MARASASLALPGPALPAPDCTTSVAWAEYVVPACTPANHPPAEPAINASASSQPRRMRPLGKLRRLAMRPGVSTLSAAWGAIGVEATGTGVGWGGLGTTIAFGVLTWNW